MIQYQKNKKNERDSHCERKIVRQAKVRISTKSVSVGNLQLVVIEKNWLAFSTQLKLEEIFNSTISVRYEEAQPHKRETHNK